MFFFFTCGSTDMSSGLKGYETLNVVCPVGSPLFLGTESSAETLGARAGAVELELGNFMVGNNS